jgi:hypothetical protein
MYHIKRDGKTTIGRGGGLWKKMRAHRAIASETKQPISPRREWIVSLVWDAPLDNPQRSLLALAI